MAARLRALFPARTRPVALLLFAAACASVLVSISSFWMAEHLPFQDYPAHLFRVHVLLSLDQPSSEYARDFFRNWGLPPNELSDAVQYALGRWFPLTTASKLFFILYLGLLPVSHRYFLSRVAPDRTAYVWLSLVLTVNLFVACANENFILSIPLFLFFAGHHLGSRHLPTARFRFVEAILLLAIYYSHMLTFACAALLVVVSLAEKRPSLRDALGGLSVLVPGVAVFVLWVATMAAGSDIGRSNIGVVEGYASVGDKFTSLLNGMLPVLLPAGHARLHHVLFAFAVLLMLLLGVSARRTSPPQDSRVLLWAVVALGLAALILPRWFIISQPDQRILFLAVLLSPALFPARKSLKHAFVIALMLLTFLVRREEHAYLKSGGEIVSYAIQPFKEVPGDVVRPGARVFPVVLEPYIFSWPYPHLFEYYHLVNGGVNPHHFISPDFALNSRLGRPPFDIYNHLPAEFTPEFLAPYDAVLLIGRDGEHGLEFGERLRQIGFREVSGNDFTAVFAR